MFYPLDRAALVDRAALLLVAKATPVDPETLRWRTRLAEIWTAINTSVGTEVLQGQDKDLSIAGIDVTLNDAGFLLARLANISRLSTEVARLVRQLRHYFGTILRALLYAMFHRTHAARRDLFSAHARVFGG